MIVKATQFRQNLFQILDQCRDTGETVRIERGGEVFLLVPELKRIPIGSAPKRPWIVKDLESLPDFSPSDWGPDDFS